MPLKTCAVRECSGVGRIRHRFPNPEKDFERYQKWIEACDYPKLQTLPPEKVYYSYRVCHGHFTLQDRSTNMFLIKKAIPTLLLPTPKKEKSQIEQIGKEVQINSVVKEETKSDPLVDIQFVNEIEIEETNVDPLEVIQSSISQQFVKEIEKNLDYTKNILQPTFQQFSNDHSNLSAKETNRSQEILLKPVDTIDERISREKEMLKDDLIPLLTKIIDKITSLEQIDILRKLIAPIAPAMEAIQNSLTGI